MANFSIERMLERVSFDPVACMLFGADKLKELSLRSNA
jgi:hypothetical protein